MSINIGEAVGYLDLDTSRFKSGFQSALQDVKQFKTNYEDALTVLNTTSGAAFTSVGTSLTNLITKPALVAGGALAGITIGKGWSRMTQLDNAKAKLEALGNSADTVKTITENVGNVVEGTAYTSAQAMTAAASAVAAGIKPGQELERYLGLIGDAAAVAGTDFNEMGSIFNKVTATGKADAEIMNQLADRGIPIWSLLAKSTGKSMDEVRAAVSSGKISIEELQSAIELGMGGAARTIGSKTITGALENIWAYIGLLGQKFLGASDDASSFAGQLLPVLNDLIKKIQDLTPKAEALGKKFGSAFTTTIKVLTSMPKGVTAFTAALLVSAGPILKFVGRTIDARNRLNAFKIASEGASASTGILSGQLTISQALFGGLGNKITGAASKVLAFAQANTTLLASLGVVAGLAALALYMNQTGTSAEEMTQKISDFIVSAAEKISQFAQQLPAIISAVSQLIPTIVTALASAAPVIIQAGVVLFTALVEAIPQVIPIIVESLPQIISALVSGIVSASGSLLKAGVTLFKALWNGMKSYGPTLLASAVAFAKKIPGKIKSGLGSLVSIGRDWLQGLWNGMKSKFDSVIDWAKTQIAKLPAAFKKILGIGSPSRISKADGAFWIEGLKLGILGKTASLLTVAKNQVRQLMGVYSGASLEATTSLGVSAPGMTEFSPVKYQQFDFDKFSQLVETGNESLAETIYEAVVTAMESFEFKLNGREFGRAVRSYK